MGSSIAWTCRAFRLTRKLLLCVVLSTPVLRKLLWSLYNTPLRPFWGDFGWPWEQGCPYASPKGPQASLCRRHNLQVFVPLRKPKVPVSSWPPAPTRCLSDFLFSKIIHLFCLFFFFWGGVYLEC